MPCRSAACADGLTQWEVTIGEALSARATRPATTASGISAATTAGCRTIRASTNGTAFRARRTRRCWSTSPGWSPDIMPAEKIMEGTKGEKSRDAGGLRRGAAPAHRRRDHPALGRVHRAAGQGRQAVLHVRGAHAAAPAHRAEPGLQGQDRQRRLGGHAGRDGQPTSARCSTRWTRRGVARQHASSSSPATTVRNSSSPGTAGPGRGAGSISPRWRAASACLS